MSNITSREKMEWGHVEWIHMSDSMSVGFITMLPHTHAKRHIHYGQEQFLYILEGRGRYYINDIRHDFQPGMIFTLEADCSHETFNDSDEAVKEILVSVPTGVRNIRSGVTDRTFSEVAEGREAMLIYRAADALRDTVKNISNIPYTVFDVGARPILQGDSFPDICKRHCDPLNDTKNCQCFRAKFGECDVEESWISYTCRHGMKTFLCPIGHDGKLIGVLRGGHLFTSGKGTVSEEEDYAAPRTAQIAIHSALEKIVESVERYIDYLSSIEALKDKDKLISDSITINEALKKDLTDVKEKVTNLKINHHFLFNTLNCIRNKGKTSKWSPQRRCGSIEEWRW